MKKIKRWLLRFMVVLVVVFVGANILAYRHAHAMMNFVATGARTVRPEGLSFSTKAKLLFKGVSVPRPEDEYDPSELAADALVLTIAGEDGVSLDAWYCNRGIDTPLVILFHGYASQKTDLLREAHKFLELGVSVFLVDFRGSGGSSKSYTTIGVCEGVDVATAVRYAKDRFSHTDTILFGRSMGAAAVLRAVHEEAITPDAVILEAVFDRMLSTVCNRFDIMGAPSFPAARLLVFWGGIQFGFNGFGNNPVEYASSLKCPVLFMHGSSDPRAKLSEGRSVYDAVPGSCKWFKEFSEAGHQSYVAAYPEQWKVSVNNFFVEIESQQLVTKNGL